MIICDYDFHALRIKNSSVWGGVPVIGVEFGYTDVPIAELKPDRLIGHMRDLPAAVHSLSQAASRS